MKEVKKPAPGIGNDFDKVLAMEESKMITASSDARYWNPQPGTHVFKITGSKVCNFKEGPQDGIIFEDKAGNEYVGCQSMLVSGILPRISEVPFFAKVIVPDEMTIGANGDYYSLRVLIAPKV